MNYLIIVAILADIQKKLLLKSKILSTGKENELVKQQDFIEKRFGEIMDLKNQGQKIMLEIDEVSLAEVEE